MKFNVGSRNTDAGVSERVVRTAHCNPFPRLPHRNVSNAVALLRGLLYSALLPLVLLPAASAQPHDEPTVDQLKARVSNASVPDKVHICVQIAEKQLDESRRLYEAGEAEKAQAPLTDVVAFSELARDYSIQSKKHQKQTEISVRAMTRKLTNVLHLLGQADQAPVKDAISRLERVRDDLLASMFPKGMK
jgi:hypothetical protein